MKRATVEHAPIPTLSLLTTMSPEEQKVVLTLCLMAAFADGSKSNLERTEFKRITDGLASPDVDTTRLYQDVLLKRVSLEQVATSLTAPEVKQLAYEMAVCVCDADEVLNEAEKTFLDDLRRLLGLGTVEAARIEQQATALTEASVPPVLPGAQANVGIEAAPQGSAETDQMVLNYAILNGALELLPESLATMGIVPLQMKMVYRVGKTHGYNLDRRHITELLSAAGVGLTSQVVEGYARKLLGGLLGKVAGGMGRMAGNQFASSAMTFATTYALGKMAQRYYGSGRTMSGAQLKELFSSLLGEAKSLHSRYAGEIQTRAQSVSPAQLLSLVRGQP